MAKFFVRGTSTKFNAIADKTAYNDSIVFLTDTKQIWQNGIYYGLSSEQAAKLDSIEDDLKALKYFETVAGNTGSASAAAASSTLNIKGTSGITTAVDASGVSIKHTNSVDAGTASGDANKTLTFGGTFTIPSVTYDAQGHITSKSQTTMTMPANPDTHHQAKNIIGKTATDKTNAATTNPFLNLIENGAVRSSHLIAGSGKVTVSSDATGKITISGANATVTTGATNGTINVDGTSVEVKGLGSAAYTDSSDYATAALGTLAENAVPKTTTVNGHALSDNVTVSKSDVGLGNVTNESKATMFTSPAFTGTPTAPTAANTVNSTQIATTAFVQSVVNEKISAADALRFKGVVDGSHALPTTNVAIGDTYKVNATGTYGGHVCEVGDMIIAIDTTPTWTVVQTNIDGAVTATSNITKDAIVVGTGSKAVKAATTVGATNKGIYLNNGVPTATTYAVNKDVPANAEFTDTKVTAVGNHYTPTGGTAATTTNGANVAWQGKVVTGITKDAAGHITGVTVGALPANPNTNTTYTFADGEGSFTVTPSGGTAQTVSIGKPSTAGTADVAKELETARTIALSGDVIGSTTFDGSTNVTITAAIDWEEL